MKYVALTTDDKVAAVYPEARPDLPNVIEIADNDPRFLNWDMHGPEDWKAKRTKPVAFGGYGTVEEQLEILGEQGIGAFQSHIAAVKTTHPKGLE